MFRTYFCFFFLLWSGDPYEPTVSSGLVRKIWTKKFGLNYSLFGSKMVMGQKTESNSASNFDEYLELPVVNDTELNLPSEFDARIQWSYCPSISEVSDQASCGSCWAVSAVDAMSDRVCIHSKGKYNFRFSAANLISCCHICGEGCGGGFHRTAWKYWMKFGIVSGGSYGSGEGCQPYPFEQCEHRMNGSVPTCIKEGPTPPCLHECQPKYPRSYKEDLHFGRSAYIIAPNEEAIKTEIYRHGPVQGSFKLYSDLYPYKSGVYEHVKGHFVFFHAVRIIGWGIENSTNVPYWLIMNSFNGNWGNHGVFKIKRGSNECYIEESVVAGLPFTKSHPEKL